MDFQQKFNELSTLVETTLTEYFDNLSTNSAKSIKEAMQYAVMNGGKRIRPILMLLTADTLDLNIDDVMPYAIALECIHSYSLVHDDLPCMDNDDYRRGKLSTHKKFGEALGVLTGDALLNYSIEIIMQKKNLGQADFKAIRKLYGLSGYRGMINGQVLDIKNENNQEVDYQLLKDIYFHKTSCLLIASLLIPSILAGDKYYDILLNLGKKLGLIFQITDDILDIETSFELLGKTPNKDEAQGKFTSIKVLGLNNAKELCYDLYLEEKKLLDLIPKSDYLKSIIDMIYNRKK